MKTGLRKYSGIFCATLVAAGLLTACANIGRPEGGPRDEKPPVFMRSTPRPGQVNFNGKNIDIYFDENIQLEDAFNKVVVSPVQVSNPQVSSGGKHVRVALRDTLLPNTTYTIDFANSIKDLNEGNILDGFAIDFSTGDTIDSLKISGMVLQAENLEPAQGMLVGAYSNLSDTAITTLQFERISRTDQYGRFTIRGLKQIPYRIYAVNDVNRDYKWDRSEDVAFFDTIVTPSVKEITVNDTLRAADDTDSIVSRQGVKFLPNDLLLTWFNEGYSAQYLKNYARPDRRRITIEFAAESDSLPTLTIAQGAKPGTTDREWARLHHSQKLDSLEYWITDPEVLATDSLLIAMRYLHTDTLEQLSWTTDTLKFYYRDRPDKPKKKKKTENENDTIPEVEYLSLSFLSSTQHEIYSPLTLQSPQPIDTLLESGYKLELQNDTLWTEVPDAKFAIDSLNPLMRRTMHMQWKPGAHYRLTVDSAAITDMYGLWNKKLTHEFTVKQPEDYSNLTLVIKPSTLPDSATMIVELLNTSDSPVRTATVSNGRAQLKNVSPGDYYVRLYIDANNNGKWDTGSLSDSIPVQPEEVYYYSKKLALKKNWDVEQAWDIYEQPLDMQKPYAILKNKPKLKKGEKDSRDTSGTEEDDEDDMWGSGFDNGNNRNGGNRGNSSNRINNPNLRRDNPNSMIRR